MPEGRTLSRGEIGELWAIDRRELIEAVYHCVDGALVLRPERFDMQGWPPGEAEKYTPVLEKCYDQGGWFYGLFATGVPVGAAVLGSRLFGRGHDRLQLLYLHVSTDYRHRGLGQKLFGLTAAEARRRGARWLYISATPSRRTIDFYMRLGCTLAAEPDPELFAFEPEDIHLEYEL